MFGALSDRLTAVLRDLTGRGVLTDEVVKEGLREVRRVLLEADVSYELARDFTERVRSEAVGVTAIKTVNPGQQLVKIVYDELVRMLGERREGIRFASVGPTVVMLVGLQGSGKTTTAAKLAHRLKKEQKAPFLVAADPYRPAAEEQLKQLAGEIDVGWFGPSDATDAASPPIRRSPDADVVAVVRNGIDAGAKQRARTVLVDRKSTL